MNGDRETGVRELGRKDGEILLAGNGNVCSIDATADVHIFSEGGRVLGKRLKILLPDQRNVAPIDTTACINVADENTHRGGNIALSSARVDAKQSDGERLCIADVFQIYGYRGYRRC